MDQQKAIQLQLAQKEHLRVTFEWAQNAFLRKFSPNSKPIAFETHEGWFIKKINDPNCRFYIASLDNDKIGTCRLDFSEDFGKAEISYLLDPRFHGKGLGFLMIELLVLEAITEANNRAKPLTLIAKVHQDNIPSLKIFEKAKFEKTSPENTEYVEFKRNINI
jgi:RimJ/RimL family protein N-acetyltransferase